MHTAGCRARWLTKPAKGEQQLVVIRDFLLQRAASEGFADKGRAMPRQIPGQQLPLSERRGRSEGSAEWVAAEMWLLGEEPSIPYCTKISLGQQHPQAQPESPWLTTLLHKERDEQISYRN